MKRMLSMLALLGTFLLWPLMAQAQEVTVTFEQVEHCTITGFYDKGELVELQSGDKVPPYTMVMFVATADEGYEVTHYIFNGEEVENTSSKGITRMVSKDMTVSARVVKKASTACVITVKQPEHGTIELRKGASQYGTPLNSGGQVEPGSQITMVINPDADYALDYWLVNNQPVEKDTGYFPKVKTITVSEATTISAVLKEAGNLITYEQPEHGTLTVTLAYPVKDVPSGTRIKEREGIKIQATVNEGYVFKHFLINDEVKEPNDLNNPVLFYYPTKDVTIKAVIEKSEPCVVTITPFEHGYLKVTYGSYLTPTVVQSGNEVPVGTELRVDAYLDEGYDLDYFLVNDVKTPSESTEYPGIKVTATSSLTLSAVAKATAAPAGCTVTLGEFSAAQGFFYAYYGSDTTPVKSGDVLPVGTVVSFQVDAEGGYELDYWLVDDVKSDDTSNPLVITLSKDVKVLPVMKKKEEPKPTQGVITMIQPKDDQGKEIGFLAASYYDDDLYEDIAVTDGMGVDLGTTITFLVTPEEGYEMDYWMINDARQELDSETPNQTIITVEGDLEVEPILKSTAAPVEKVRLSVQEEGVGGFAMVRYQTPGSTTWEKPAEGTNPTLDLPIGTKVRVLANISIDGATVAFTHNGNPVAADQLTNEGLTYEFTLEAAADIKVIFTEGVIGFQIFYDCDKHATITGTADGEPFTSGDKLPLGARVELTVTPEAGYEVKDWVDADFVLIEGTEYQNPYTFTVDGSVSAFAEIQKKTTAFVKVSYEGTGGYLETKYVEPNGSGNPQSIFGDKRIPLGSVVTVKAKFFMTGDFLVAYTNNGNPVPAEALTEDGFVYTFTANEDADVHAVFSEKPAPAVDYTITFEAGEGGTVTATVDMEPIESGAKIAAGTKIKILATPDEDYEIDEWLVDGEPVANTGLNFYYLSLSKDTNVKVTFRSTKPVEYVVTVDPILPSAEAGTVQLFKKNGDAVESGKSVVTGTEMYVEVKPADKYELETLQVNNKTLKVGDENLVNLSDGGYKYLFTVTEATTIKATFKLGGAVEQLTASPIVAYVTNGGTRLEITGAAEGAEVRLYDYTGQLLLSSTEHALDISALPAGSYIVLVGNYTTRIVK